MFTGIVEDIGKIIRIIPGRGVKKLEIEAEKTVLSMSEGDSISVSGVCLTVTGFNAKKFTVDVVEETLVKSTLKDLKQGDFVNLERAMQMSGRFNGHFVLGHVDGTGKIDVIKNMGNNFEVIISCGREIMKYIVEKGSVCIDGISLTIAEVFYEGFKIAVIPFTLENTILKYKNKGSEVNIETDIIGKYVHKFMNGKEKKDLNFDLLRKYGF